MNVRNLGICIGISKMIRGQRSRVFTIVDSDAVELAEIFNSDHHVTLDNSQGFVQAVNAFLAKH